MLKLIAEETDFKNKIHYRVYRFYFQKKKHLFQDFTIALQEIFKHPFKQIKMRILIGEKIFVIPCTRYMKFEATRCITENLIDVLAKPVLIKTEMHF